MPLFAPLHEQGGLLRARCAKVVAQRRAAVAHAPAAKRLSLMDMAEGHIVKGLKDLRAHVLKAANARLLRAAALRAGNILVRKQHVARGGVDLHRADDGGKGRGVVGDVRVFAQRRAHVRGPDEG